MREKADIGGGNPIPSFPRDAPQVGQIKGIVSAFRPLTVFQRTPLPLSLGDVVARSEDGEGKWGCVYWHKKWSVSVLIRSISCFPPPIKREGVVRVGQCPRFPLSPIDTAPDSGYTEFQRGDSIMKDTILSVIRLIATPVLLMVLGLILLIHPDSASALVAQILGWVLLIAGVVFAVSAIAGHFDTLGKVLSAVCCFAVGAWLLRNPLMLAAGLGRLAGILLVVRGIQDILNAGRYHYGILPAVITTVLGAVLIALPMATSRFVMSLCGLLVLIVGVAILVDRLKNRRPKEPSESDIIDAL